MKAPLLTLPQQHQAGQQLHQLVLARYRALQHQQRQDLVVGDVMEEAKEGVGILMGEVVVLVVVEEDVALSIRL